MITVTTPSLAYFKEYKSWNKPIKASVSENVSTYRLKHSSCL